MGPTPSGPRFHPRQKRGAATTRPRGPLKHNSSYATRSYRGRFSRPSVKCSRTCMYVIPSQVLFPPAHASPGVAGPPAPFVCAPISLRGRRLRNSPAPAFARRSLDLSGAPGFRVNNTCDSDRGYHLARAHACTCTPTYMPRRRLAISQPPISPLPHTIRLYKGGRVGPTKAAPPRFLTRDRSAAPHSRGDVAT